MTGGVHPPPHPCVRVAPEWVRLDGIPSAKFSSVTPLLVGTPPVASVTMRVACPGVPKQPMHDRMMLATASLGRAFSFLRSVTGTFVSFADNCAFLFFNNTLFCVLYVRDGFSREGDRGVADASAHARTFSRSIVASCQHHLTPPDCGSRSQVKLFSRRRKRPDGLHFLPRFPHGITYDGIMVANLAKKNGPGAFQRHRKIRRPVDLPGNREETRGLSCLHWKGRRRCPLF